MVFRLIFVGFSTAALLFMVSLFGFFCFAILALPLFERCRFFFALELRFLVLTLTTESVEIVRIVVELVVFIFAAVRSLLPEAVPCHHTQVSLQADNGRSRGR